MPSAAADPVISNTRTARPVICIQFPIIDTIWANQILRYRGDCKAANVPTSDSRSTSVVEASFIRRGG